ncbi:MAG: cytochrome b/b6 domain-containing protein [Nitrospiraceae bacterium]|nr:cytochrome b/b6 domain-containing protein [Nitrospiraceae bacterium]
MSTVLHGYVRRFGIGRILEHQANALVFTILVITGLSQRFHEYRLSHWIITTLGGVDAMRIIHRYTGFLFILLIATHIAVGVYGVIVKRWPASMMINVDDFRNAIQNMKYYFGITSQPALCDRYDYKQKFEYWGVIAGGFLMIATGLILWFPVLVARFLPGEFIPAAKAAHSNEALLAFLVIITWHIYNSIFSPEVFPLDTAIFTGRISRERMVHEHPLELAHREQVSVEEIIKHRHVQQHDINR